MGPAESEEKYILRYTNLNIFLSPKKVERFHFHKGKAIVLLFHQFLAHFVLSESESEKYSFLQQNFCLPSKASRTSW